MPKGTDKKEGQKERISQATKKKEMTEEGALIETLRSPSPASVSSSHVCDCTGLGLHPLGKSESLFFMLFFLEDEVHYLILWSGLQGLRSAVYVVWPFVVEGHYFHILREPGSSQMTNNIIRRLWRTRFLHAQRGVLLWKIWEKTDTSHLRNQAPASCWESLQPEIKCF